MNVCLVVDKMKIVTCGMDSAMATILLMVPPAFTAALILVTTLAVVILDAVIMTTAKNPILNVMVDIIVLLREQTLS